MGLTKSQEINLNNALREEHIKKDDVVYVAKNRTGQRSVYTTLKNTLPWLYKTITQSTDAGNAVWEQMHEARYRREKKEKADQRNRRTEAVALTMECARIGA